MKSKSFMKSVKIGYIILSILFCICGILILIKPEVSTITLCYALGIIMILFGIVKILGYFSKYYYRYIFQYDLAFGILLLTLGGLMLIHPLSILKIFYTIFGILFLTDGLFKIQVSIDTKTLGIPKWWIILIFAILTGILGLLMLLRPLKSATFFILLFGISLLAEGILNLCTILFAAKAKDAFK